MAATSDEVPVLEPIENAGFRDLDPNGVLEQPFLERYNKHLEMPIGWSLAVLALVSAFAILIFVQQISKGRDTRPVPLSNLDGDDDAGLGMEGSKGSEAPIAIGSPPSAADVSKFMQDVPERDLKDVKDQMKLDVQGDIEIPDSIAAPIASLEQKIRDKLIGTKRGEGGAGTGGDGNKGGPGGFGHDSTRARGLRWVIQFDTRTGRDYLNQLNAMGATLMVPTPDGKKMFIFKDLKNPKPGQVAADSDLDAMAQNMQFSEIKRDSIDAVCEALGMKDHNATVFFAFFPRKIEEKMATLEKNYKNVSPDKVRQTKFRVLMRGGEFDLLVVDQQLK